MVRPDQEEGSRSCHHAPVRIEKAQVGGKISKTPPNSRQTTRFDQLSRQRWLYRLALGQPHQQDFIETVSQLPDDGRQQFALRLSAWKDQTDPAQPPLITAATSERQPPGLSLTSEA